MNTFTLYSGPLSMFGAKTQIAALEKGLRFERVMVPFEFGPGYSPKHPEVLRINPKKQVPVLVDGDLEIFDSTQIIEYLEDLQPEPALWPRDLRARARARLLELKSDEVYFPHIVKLMGLQQALDTEPAVTAIAEATQYYGEMDARLQANEWLAGDYSFADIAFYMAALFGERMGARVPSSTARLIAWRDRMSARPAVREVVVPMAKWLVSKGRPLPGFLQKMVMG